MKKKKTWVAEYEENGGEYYGTMTITALELSRDLNSDCILIADGVKIELDERITEIVEATP